MSETYLLSPSSAAIEKLPVAYSEVDAQGVIRAVNQAACRMHDMVAEELVGRSIWEFVPRDEAARDRVDFTRALASGEDPPTIRRSLYTAGGEYRTHEIHRRVMRDSSGQPAGFSCVTFDVSELEAAHQESKQARLWLESAISAIPQAVILTDALGFVRYANTAAEEVTGWQARELVGQQIEMGVPILRASSPSRKPLSFRSALDETWNGDVELLNRNREPVSTWLSACPILDQERGVTNGVVIVFRSPRTRAVAPDE
ncbi:MAG TPA: PAS domain S-box protein [Acidobacteriaceae bacterium]|jgi:PAS domain S-box-containing protein|nr:PAS domain S-box protein [Acidobacteriaceae bacterium]